MSETILRRVIPGTKLLDISGERYGRLIAVRFVGKKNGATLWECRCDCGAMTMVQLANLRSGSTTSCGCGRREWLEASRYSLVGQRFGRWLVVEQ